MPNGDTKLKAATIRFNTPGHRDNKNRDTSISVYIHNRIEITKKVLLVRLEDFAGNQEFPDPSSFRFDLQVVSAIFYKDLVVPTVSISILPHGNDRWIFQYIVSLTFGYENDPRNDQTIDSTGQDVILDQDVRTYNGVWTYE